ncbi:MAG: hypothetical protein C0171_05925 [Caldisphaera sp.]|uniref:hypothetical protein n=1 Tax=Caldisphaera sp. TaxID=2060322 RepID=UPI000CAFCF9D|nr:MAG: hypothetical protein C0171_05925 [Caldisphaera sp.]
METYKILGLIGLLLVLLVTVMLSIFILTGFYYSYGFMGGMMGYYRHYYVYGYSFMLFPLAIGGISVILAAIGISINDKVASGILLILSAFISIPIAFGGFGIGFILLLLAGILALIK